MEDNQVEAPVTTAQSPASFPPQSTAALVPEWSQIAERLHQMSGVALNASYFAWASNASGGFVRLAPDLNCLPVLDGSDGEPVLLYRVVEAIEEYVDVGGLKQDLGTLSLAQLAGVFGFLRRLSQFNTAGVDVDDLEERLLENDPRFHAELRALVFGQEQLRVLCAE